MSLFRGICRNMIHTPALASDRSKLEDEAGRMLALRRYTVLDTPSERNFDLITGLVRDLLRVPICAVSLIDDTRQWFKAIAGSDLKATPRSQAFCDHTIRSYEWLAVPDATQDARFAGLDLVTQEPFIRSYAGVPLTSADGYNLGALCVIDQEPRTYDTEQLELLSRFAALIVEQLELRTLAAEDSLTGALGRRAFLGQATGALRRFEREHRPIALITFDIDHFKSVNDRWGHPVGDRVLKAVAAACRAELRPLDVLGRLGGEEFAVLLTEATPEMAMNCAERLRATVSEVQAEPAGRITESFGVASAAAGMLLETWIEQADSALYDAKRAGRDRCILAKPKLRAVA